MFYSVPGFLAMQIAKDLKKPHRPEDLQRWAAEERERKKAEAERLAALALLNTAHGAA